MKGHRPFTTATVNIKCSEGFVTLYSLRILINKKGHRPFITTTANIKCREGFVTLHGVRILINMEGSQTLHYSYSKHKM